MLMSARKEQREEERGDRDEGEEKRGWRVAYQNVGGGIEATNILLACGRQAEWDFIFVAEAWEGKKGERTTQQGYRIYCEIGSKITLYVREEVDMATLGLKVDTNENWIAAGDLVTGVYLSPSTRIDTIREQLLDIPSTDNLISNFNCTQSHKRRALLEDAFRQGLTEKPIQGKTWRRWFQPQARWVESKPDTVFSNGSWNMMEKEWTISDHTIITSMITAQIKKRKLLVTDWESWSNFKEDEQKDTTYSGPIASLTSMAKLNLKPKKFSPKPW